MTFVPYRQAFSTTGCRIRSARSASTPTGTVDAGGSTSMRDGVRGGQRLGSAARRLHDRRGIGPAPCAVALVARRRDERVDGARHLVEGGAPDAPRAPRGSRRARGRGGGRAPPRPRCARAACAARARAPPRSAARAAGSPRCGRAARRASRRARVSSSCGSPERRSAGRGRARSSRSPCRVISRHRPERAPQQPPGSDARRRRAAPRRARATRSRGSRCGLARRARGRRSATMVPTPRPFSTIGSA